MSTVRRLVMRDGKRLIEPFSPSGQSADTIPVVVEISLLPSQPEGDGLWFGHDLDTPARSCAGWGPAASHISANKDELLMLPGEASDRVAAGLYLPASAIDSALKSLTHASTVSVIGEGLIAALARKVVSARGFSLMPPEPGADVDLLIDVEAGPERWATALPALRAHGTILIFVPPWSKSADFDFYPQIHSRSLEVLTRRWHVPSEPVDQNMINRLGPIITSIADKNPWLRPMDLESPTLQDGVWQWLDWEPDGVGC